MGERSNYDLVVQWFHQKLNEGTMDLSTNNSSQANNINGDGSFFMPLDNNSSVGSNSNNNSRTPILSGSSPGLKHAKPHSVPDCLSQHVFSKWSRNLSDDALAQALMDSKYPVEGLKYYEEWTIDLTKLVMGSAFAEGTSAKIFRGKYNGEDVAIKILERPADKPDIAEDLERQFEEEVMLLATFNHPNIVQFIGACRKPMVWCILTAYAKGGSVRQFLNNRRNRPMPLKLAVKYALDVAKGMAYMHGLGFIHRDLKSDNLLIAADKSIKIADFGVARVEVHSVPMTPQTGTLRWMAPEMRQNWPYTHKVDVYSFGIVLWELITGLLPFQEMSPLEAAASVVLTDARPPIPKDCPPILSEIMTRCWDRDADFRPPFTEIVNMLENAETEIMTTVRRARFRCCITQPMIID